MRVVSYPVNSDNMWCEVRPHAAREGAALFLDRDGVVVEEVGYLSRIEDIAVIPGAAAVIVAANRRAIPVVLVTNQAGIGRGYYSWPDFSAVQDAILSALAAEGARVDAVYACPHHPQGQGPFVHSNHPARKPNPGMLVRAAVDLDLDLRKSWLVGDKSSDIDAAMRAGLAGAMQVMTGYGQTERCQSAALTALTFDLRFGQSIADAVTLPIFAAEDAQVGSGK